jgi:endonuclease-3
MAVNNTTIDEVVLLLREGLKDLPEPSVTLVGKRWKSPFLVLISCLLSLRTQDKTTLPASERLFAVAETPEKMRKLSEDKIRKLIYPVGFYKTKAKRIIEICDRLVEKYNGQVPNDLDELLTFKGVGRKTANLVLTEGFAKPGICVDTHVHRISNRFGYVKTKNPNETETALRKKLPKQYWMEYNTLLVMWGQNICKPISPLCSKCKVRLYCPRIGVVMSR